MRKEDKMREEKCGRFREELELLRGPGDTAMTRSGLLAEMPVEVRGHAAKCESCGQALEDVAETRKLLVPLTRESLVMQAGPWFASKIMSAIAAEEKEIATRDGFWFSIRKLAPRLAAVCALLLIVVGTWAVQTRRANLAKQSMASWDSLFEPGTTTALNDDAMASTEAHR